MLIDDLFERSDCYLKYYQSALCGNAYDQYRLAETYYYNSDRSKIYSADEWYKKAMLQYTKAAKKNSTEAQFMLARLYYWGKGVHQDTSTAFEWLSKAVGFEISHLIRTNIKYSNTSKILPNNRIDLIKFFTKTAEQIFLIDNSSLNSSNLIHVVSKIQFEVAQWLYYGLFGIIENKSEAVEWLLKSAQNGHHRASMIISKFYSEGCVVPKNNSLAHIWQKIGLGSPNHQYSLAYRYEYGIDLPIDIERATIWYKKAARGGSSKAECALANCYINGKGLKKDKNKAFELYKKAANKGNCKALYNLAYCFRYGVGCSVNHEQAFKLYYYAANQGYIKALYCVALCYERGIGIEKNLLQSINCYMKAFRQGDLKSIDRIEKMRCNIKQEDIKKALSDAQYEIAKCYYNGEGIAKNKKRAIKLYTLSSENGNAEAQTDLGEIYYKRDVGLSVNDMSEGVKWFKMASKNGNHRAKYFLAQCYEQGYGIQQNDQQALLLYNDVSLYTFEDKYKNYSEWAKRSADRINNRLSQENLNYNDTYNKDIKNLNKIETQLNYISDIVEKNLNISVKTNIQLTNLTSYIKNNLNKDIEKIRQDLDIAKRSTFNDESLSRFLVEVRKMVGKKIESDNDELVYKTKVELKNKFGIYWNKLHSNTKSSLISSRVMWLKCQNISDNFFDYSGICICATAALENELQIHLYKNYQNFISKYEKDCSKWPKSLTFFDNIQNKYIRNNKFGLGKINNIFNEKNSDRDWLEEYLSSIIAQNICVKYKLKYCREYFTKSIFGYDSFKRQIFEINNKYRIKSAHAGNLGIYEAEKCCNKIMGNFEAVNKINKIDCILIELLNFMK